MTSIAIIGAGAAGFFTAINLKEQCPNVHVTLYESAAKPLGKVAITGGGRCNVTNTFEEVSGLVSVYPRGEKLMKRCFKVFDYHDAYRWFESHGIQLTVQEDQCVFPRSQDAMEIVNMLISRARALGVQIRVAHRVEKIERVEVSETDATETDAAEIFEKSNSRYRITFMSQEHKPTMADAVVLTSGGSPKQEGLSRLLDTLPIELVHPVPSLFSFQLTERKALAELMGTVVSPVIVGLQGTKYKADGTLLITHWGMSGPAILKLSSYAARHLHDCLYDANLTVNWTGVSGEAQAQEAVRQAQSQHTAKQLGSVRLYGFTNRLWQFILQRAGLPVDKRWSELGQKGINRLVNVLTNDAYHIEGQNKHKEEFVTCGGVALSNVNGNTLECKTCPGLYFAGEVLDVDAITGGFNLQAAWSMGYVVAKALAEAEKEAKA